MEDHFFRGVGFAVRRGGHGELLGSAAVTPEMHVPGTDALRLSILATCVDVLVGLLAVDVVAPRVPVTLMLDLHLSRPPTDLTRMELVARQVKVGRSVFVADTDLRDEDGTSFGFATATFMVAPDPTVVFPEGANPIDAMRVADGRLTRPFAEVAGVALRAPGVAEVALTSRGTNASGTLNGGLIALLAEEAALSVHPGSHLAMMSIHFLSPVRVGPGVATAEVSESPAGTLAQVTVRDEGRDGSLAVLVTTRAFPG